jgi:hypothetical protein
LGLSPDAPPPRTATFTSDGGTVVARCQRDGEVKALSWEAAEGYRAARVVRGPALAVRVWFVGPTEVRMTIRCRDGVPTWVNAPA